LSVAREVFLELGIRATTLAVAARAGVAEGTIFRRFRSKEELFRAAMQFDPDEALAFVERLPSLAGKADLRATLGQFAEKFLELGRVAVPVMMMSWSNPDSPTGERWAERGARHRRVLRAVRAFFEAELRGGRLCQCDPDLLARVLLGSLHQYCLSELFASEPGAPSPSEFSRAVVDLLLGANQAPSVPPNVKGNDCPAVRLVRARSRLTRRSKIR
jgi:AcrR family transcriptional regulator